MATLASPRLNGEACLTKIVDSAMGFAELIADFSLLIAFRGNWDFRRKLRLVVALLKRTRITITGTNDVTAMKGGLMRKTTTDKSTPLSASKRPRRKAFSPLLLLGRFRSASENLKDLRSMFWFTSQFDSEKREIQNGGFLHTPLRVGSSRLTERLGIGCSGLRCVSSENSLSSSRFDSLVTWRTICRSKSV